MQLIREACSDNPRDKAIIELLLQTGIKLAEITKLTINDIELGEKTDFFCSVEGHKEAGMIGTLVVAVQE